MDILRDDLGQVWTLGIDLAFPSQVKAMDSGVVFAS